MKPVSDQLFVFENRDTPRVAYERCSARDLGLAESWLRDAIFHAPELVIGPCRAAGLTEDEWYPWQREYRVEVGPIDVLLLSSQGRVAVVETKLATNPELRRRVLAQALDYLTHLADRFTDELPDIPSDEHGQRIADPDDIRESVAQGDMLVIIASDEIDPRVAKLSRSLLSDHLVKQWDLALIDLALYRPLPGAPDQYVVVPHLRNLIESEPRQVVRIIVEGDTPSARIEVERITVDEDTPPVPKWNEKRFFDNLEAENVPTSVRELAIQLRDLARRFPASVRLAWGRGRDGSMVVKRHNWGLIEVYSSGRLKFRLPLFMRALGEEAGEAYRRALEQLVPAATRMEYPRVPVHEAAKVAPALYDLIRQTLERVEGIER
jgi:hypothetical protein